MRSKKSYLNSTSAAAAVAGVDAGVDASVDADAVVGAGVTTRRDLPWRVFKFRLENNFQ